MKKPEDSQNVSLIKKEDDEHMKEDEDDSSSSSSDNEVVKVTEQDELVISDEVERADEQIKIAIKSQE